MTKDELNKYRNSKGQLWVNVASSNYTLSEFVNLDNSPFLHSMWIYRCCRRLFPKKYQLRYNDFISASQQTLIIKHDCRGPLFFPACSVDHILCSHFLEHVFPDEAELILKDFYRVLKDGGTVSVLVPDLEKLAEQYLHEVRRGEAKAAEQFLLGSILTRKVRGRWLFRLFELTGAFGLQHYWMYDRLSLEDLMKKTGFVRVDIDETPSRSFRAGVDDGSLRMTFSKR